VSTSENLREGECAELQSTRELDPRLPSVAAFIVGACSDESLFGATAAAILQQDYAGNILLVIPEGAELPHERVHDCADGSRRIVVSPRASAPPELDCNTAFAMALALQPPPDFLALLHCGERPPTGWLESLRRAQEEFDADLVLGPVKAVFTERPADWMIAGAFFDRLGFQRGPMPRPLAADNSLIRAAVVRSLLPRIFAVSAPGESEWIDFAYRVEARGFTSIWANDAIVFDSVPKSRMDEQWVLHCEYSKAYATARARCAYQPSRIGATLRQARALGQIAAGLASSGVFKLNHFRHLQAQMTLARARGTIAGCAGRETQKKEIA
jgi:hypothetical protein